MADEGVNIVGSGGMAFATGYLLSKAGLRVQMVVRDPAALRRWRMQEHADKYGWMTLFPFPPGLHLCAPADRLDGTMVVLAVPTQALPELDYTRFARAQTIVCMQKGFERTTKLDPVTFVEKRVARDQHVALFTGEGFAMEMTAGAESRFIISSRSNQAIHGCFEVFRQVQSFWLEDCGDPRTVTTCTAARTVISMIEGLVAGYLEERYSRLPFPVEYRHRIVHNSMASAIPAIRAEAKRLALALGADPFWVEHQAIAQVFDCDLVLCGSDASRNFRVGRRLGLGQSLEEATADIEGVVEGLSNIPVIAEMLPPVKLERLPYFREVVELICHGRPLEECAANILDRRMRRSSPG